MLIHTIHDKIFIFARCGAVKFEALKEFSAAYLSTPAYFDRYFGIWVNLGQFILFLLRSFLSGPIFAILGNSGL